MQARSEGWKHQTTTDSRAHGEPVGVSLYDDERPGFTTIYLRFADGKEYPARDVNMSKPAHAESVIDAWQARGETIDHRAKPVSGPDPRD